MIPKTSFLEWFERCRALVETERPGVDLFWIETKEYLKIVKVNLKKEESAWAFVDKKEGYIFRAASWKIPAEHASGNIFDKSAGMSQMTSYGPKYLKQKGKNMFTYEDEKKIVQDCLWIYEGACNPIAISNALHGMYLFLVNKYGTDKANKFPPIALILHHLSYLNKSVFFLGKYQEEKLNYAEEFSRALLEDRVCFV